MNPAIPEVFDITVPFLAFYLIIKIIRDVKILLKFNFSEF